MTFKPGDRVRTKSGYEGKILLISRLSAFVDIEGHDELRASPHLLRELTKIGSSKDRDGDTPGSKPLGQH